jgi:transitional endoplasmic reticulum ATPase
MPLDEDVNLEQLSRDLDGFVGSDIEALCREAGLIALRENIDADRISNHHFLDARQRVHATMTPAAQEYYEKIEMRIKKEAGKRGTLSDDFT